MYRLLQARGDQSYCNFNRSHLLLRFWCESCFHCHSAVLCPGPLAHSNSRSTKWGSAMLQVPVFWPILLIYFIVLFGMTMKKQIAHMIKWVAAIGLTCAWLLRCIKGTNMSHGRNLRESLLLGSFHPRKTTSKMLKNSSISCTVSVWLYDLAIITSRAAINNPSDP